MFPKSNSSTTRVKYVFLLLDDIIPNIRRDLAQFEMLIHEEVASKMTHAAN